MSIDAMKQALAALEQYTNVVTSVNDPNSWASVSDGGKPARDAITALRAAIEQPERTNQCGETCERAKLCAVCANGIEQAQEPVAWMHNLIEGNAITHRPADIDRHPERWTALYTAPPPCPTCEALARSVMMDQTSHDMAPRQWQGLTDEERGITAAETWGSVLIAPQSYQAFARAIEAKLKEKNT